VILTPPAFVKLPDDGQAERAITAQDGALVRERQLTVKMVQRWLITGERPQQPLGVTSANTA
jgi:hypothetical protein